MPRLKKQYLITLYLITILISPSLFAINDTGITSCADDTTDGLPCPQPLFPDQDAEHGRDFTDNDNSDGHAGFSFTKLDSDGNPLAASASDWSCVKDNVTGLVWEIKTDDGRLQDKDHTYSWYNTDNNTNGGLVGNPNGGTCFPGGGCDTQRYTQAVNSLNLCGTQDWRLPSIQELASILSLDRHSPAIETNYFPNTSFMVYWSASPSPTLGRIWFVNFQDGLLLYNLPGTPCCSVRLVRGGP